MSAQTKQIKIFDHLLAIHGSTVHVASRDQAVADWAERGLLFYEALQTKLEAQGFSFHTGSKDDPVAVDCELVGKHWYCWCGPNNAWDCESGTEFDTLEQAVLEALDCALGALAELDNE
jgi:hypothetical protein